MRIADFDYHLPQELIAQAPLTERDASRMLVVNRQTQSWTDTAFQRFVDHLTPKDVVVLNNTRVIPARLLGRRHGSGGRVEVFLVRKLGEGIWQALVRPGGRLKRGDIVDFGNHLKANLIDQPGTELRQVRFECEGSFDEALAQMGLTPLPPYIKRSEPSELDRARYQTVYARQPGAVAAPTAGLHFTAAQLAEVRHKAAIAEITLHVGWGTFEPVRVEEVEQHRVTQEHFKIDGEAANSISTGKKQGGRIIAVGTTTVRALESASRQKGEIVAQEGESQLTILPGYEFTMVDALLTNFHLPKSSLLLLVSAFAGKELTLAAYRHAIDQRYRFYSYGDCMFIL